MFVSYGYSQGISCFTFIIELAETCWTRAIPVASFLKCFCVNQVLKISDGEKKADEFANERGFQGHDELATAEETPRDSRDNTTSENETKKGGKGRPRAGEKYRVPSSRWGGHG